MRMYLNFDMLALFSFYLFIYVLLNVAAIKCKCLSYKFLYIEFLLSGL